MQIDLRWRAYAVDHRGHGDSDKSPVGAYEHAHISADVIAICDALGKPPLLVGASLGGVAARFAQGRSTEQLFRSLVLVDITPDIDMDGARRIISFMADSPDGYANLDEAAEAISAFATELASRQHTASPACSVKERTDAGGGTGIRDYSTLEKHG